MRNPVPIHRTLMKVIFISCGAALLITSTGYLAFELVTYRRTSIQQLQTLGKVIASNSTAALAFDNTDDATTVLSAFQADPNIRAAVLYDRQGRIFASYRASPDVQELPAAPGRPGYEFQRFRLGGYQPVMEGNRQLGTLYVEAGLDTVFRRLQLSVLIATLVAALSLLAAWLVSRRMQPRMLRPVQALADIARAVSDRHDYSVRAAPTGALEFDQLTDSFNHMLTRIQESDSRLQAQIGRLGLLQHITRAIGDRQDMASIFQVVLATLEENMPVDFAALMLHEPAASSLSVNRVGHRSRGYLDVLGLSEGVIVLATSNGLARCLTGQLVYEPETAEVPSPFVQRFAAAGLHSLVIAPLVVESAVSGVLLCARQGSNDFSSPQCEFLMQLSEHVALASHQARLYVALQRAYDDLKQSQQALLQQERLRALGQMASGIAHDINNAISPVSLYTESLLEREPNLSERTRSYLTTIQQAIDDVSRTVARMREFYRERESRITLEQVDINRAVQQVVELTRPRWEDLPQSRGVSVDTQTHLDPALPKILGADNEIRDALTNLVFNAVDAMPNGGKLTVGTFALENPDGSVSAVIEVTDTGIGMDEDTRRRCLEPFFTTKGERGTGLGLPMVYGMVQRHGAQLEVDSSPGRGTTMRLIFNAYAAGSMPDKRLAVLSAPGRPLAILVVDDDPMLVRSLQDILQEDGHKVTTTSGGQQGIDAVAAATRRGQRFDVVITDLGMPHVDGRRVAAAVKALAPRTPVILLTGWGQRLLASNDAPEHVDRVLSKPPRLQDLRAAFADLAP